MIKTLDESQVPVEQRYLRVEGIVESSVREKVLAGVEGTKPGEPLFFVSYGYADLPIGKEFDIVFSASNSAVHEENRVRIERVTQQFSKPFPAIPSGWKTICCFGFPDGVPKLLEELPVVKAWHVSSNDVHVLLCDRKCFAEIAADRRSKTGSERFKDLCAEIVGKPQISGERLQEVMREVRLLGDVSTELHEALTEQLALRNWGGIFRLIWVIQYFPSSIFTEILCQLLDDQKDRGLGESVVDALFYIKDPRAVPSLLRAIDYYEVGDDDRHLNRKIIYTLGRIRTVEAIEAIKQGLKSDDRNIRDAARAELDRISAGRGSAEI